MLVSAMSGVEIEASGAGGSAAASEHPPVVQKSSDIEGSIAFLGLGVGFMAGLSCFGIVLFVGLYVYFSIQRRKRRRKVESSKIDKFKINPDRLVMTKVLGSGAFGIVKFGRLRGDDGHYTDVAVKMLRDDTNVTEMRNFRREIEMMKTLGNHPNVVSLVGYRTIGRYPFLVVEYCPKGDLLSFLRDTLRDVLPKLDERRQQAAPRPESTEGCTMVEEPPGNPSTVIGEDDDAYIYTVIAGQDSTVTVLDMLNFGRQIATGMEFLSNKRIVHRDLAARNILVCDQRVVKISDFGLSRDIYLENIYRKTESGRMPFKWMAIESLMHQVYTTHSDVWAFGILLWEIVTLGCNPYPGIPTIEILKRLQTGYRMERPPNCSVPLYNAMMTCWRTKPADRPTFTILRKELDKLIRETADHQYIDADDISEIMSSDEEGEGIYSPRRSVQAQFINELEARIIP